MNQVIQHDGDKPAQPEPFARKTTLSNSVNHGSVAIEQERAIAEAQGKLTLAKKFPRDEMEAHSDLMKACKSKGFAEIAFYSVPRAGGAVSGPSIRMAEEIARVYGNFQYGHRELSRDSNKSEVEVFAWDMQKNNYSTRQITVFHVRDTKNGPMPLRDQKDIDDRIANVASKQVRGRILALLPKYLVEEAIQECKKTLSGTNDEPIEARIRRMTGAFAKFGVTIKHLENYLGHNLDQTTSDELVELVGIFNSVKEGTPIADFFSAELQLERSENTAASIAKTVQAAKDAPKKEAPAQAAQQEKEPAQEASKTAPRAARQQKAVSQQAVAEMQTETQPVAEEKEMVGVVEDVKQQPSIETQRTASAAEAISSDDGTVNEEEELF